MPSSQNTWWRQQLKQLQRKTKFFSKEAPVNHHPRSPARLKHKPIPKSQRLFPVIRATNSFWSWNNREHFLLWIRGENRQHFGPKCRIPDLFLRRDEIFFALQARRLQWYLPPPFLYHDLLAAAAKVGALEERIGYRFKDKMKCIEALKVTGDSHPMYFNGQIHDVSRQNRLALLGDRILSLVLCEMWYQTGTPTSEYNIVVTSVVTRAALNVRGRHLNFDKYVVHTINASPTGNNVAETFEAILGAVYVDSNFDRQTIRRVIEHTGLADKVFQTSKDEMKDINLLESLEEAKQQETKQHTEKEDIHFIPKLGQSGETEQSGTSMQDIPNSESRTQDKSAVVAERQAVISKPEAIIPKPQAIIPESQVVIVKSQPLIQEPQAEEPTLEPSDATLKDAEYTPQESSDSMHNEPAATEIKERDLWVKAIEKSRKLKSNGTMTEPEKIYATLVQKKERARMTEEQVQATQARKAENKRIAKEQQQAAKLRKLEKKVAKHAKKKELREAAVEKQRAKAEARKLALSEEVTVSPPKASEITTAQNDVETNDRTVTETLSQNAVIQVLPDAKTNENTTKKKTTGSRLQSTNSQDLKELESEIVMSTDEAWESPGTATKPGKRELISKKLRNRRQ